MDTVILASGSPRRKALLEGVGLHLQVLVPDVDETIPEHFTPEEAVLELATRKARAIHHSLEKEETIIAADTIVTIDGTILGKPSDEFSAVRMLKQLSGRTHQVYTGVCLIQNGLEESFYNCTSVTFYPLSDKEIRDYVSTGEPLDKAGAYGIQGKGALLVKEICGDYYSVMGLPLAETLRRLRK